MLAVLPFENLTGDPDQEYVINASSFLGKYTLDVNRNESGLLETVGFSSDTTAVAKQLASSVAGIAGVSAMDHLFRLLARH